MTTMDASAQPATRARRLENVVRLHVANPWATVLTPALVFGVVFVLNLAIWYIVAGAAGGRDHLDKEAFANNGGVWWIVGFLVVAAAQAMNPYFRFALGMGFTRRDYYIGTIAYLTLLAVMFSTGISLLAMVERATHGWGIGGHFFSLWAGIDASPWQTFAVMALVQWAFIGLGILAATMFARWSAPGLYAFFGLVAIAVTAVFWLQFWAPGLEGSVGRFLTGHSPVGLALSTVPVTVVCLAAGYVVLRRATTRN